MKTCTIRGKECDCSPVSRGCANKLSKNECVPDRDERPELMVLAGNRSAYTEVVMLALVQNNVWGR